MIIVPSTIPQQPQAEFPQLDSGLAVPTFLPGIKPLFKMVESPFSKFKEDKVRMLSVQDHKGMLQVYGEYVRSSKAWFKEKVLLVQAQAEGKELDEEQLAFLADPGVADGQYGINVLSEVVQIVLWYLDSGCSKYMTRNRSQLINFISKFLGTARFGNDKIANIMGYKDYQLGNVMISRVYYVEGLGYNFFSVGQFYDSDLEVAFHKHTCHIRDLEGVDLLKGSRGSNLYTLSLENMMSTSPICLLSKASKTKSWLWHRRLSHLNFDYITQLAKQGMVRGLPRLKFQKDHLCSARALGKSLSVIYISFVVYELYCSIHRRNINPVVAKQVALDNSLVPSEKILKIVKCNARIEFSKPQREEKYQVTLDALKLSPCYPAFMITAEVPKVYMHQFWNTIHKIKDTYAYRFKLDKKKFRVDSEVFHDILQIFPRLHNQAFVEPPSEEELVTFI
ncbi:retrovirus-related pol polyprotein from transposon TNT 1-94 [Tanacetum coccineum]